MRRFAWNAALTLLPAVKSSLSFPFRRESTSKAGPSDPLDDVAAKRQRPAGGLGSSTGASAERIRGSMPSAAEMPKDPKVEAELSTADIERTMDKLAKMPPERIDKLFSEFEEQENAQGRVLEDDALYQLDVSLQRSTPTKVFWRDVDVARDVKQPGWFNVTLDGRKVKAFESARTLSVPSEELAYACAHEWASQSGMLNKLLMPMTDLASGAHHVTAGGIIGRIDYLMSFFLNDNLYFRSEQIEYKQDKAIEPLTRWFERVYDVEVPRIVGIGQPRFHPAVCNRIRDALIAQKLNHYQIVAFCVVAQFTSSFILPLALFNGLTTIDKAMRISRAEELWNIEQHGQIEGYHDIRAADVAVKVAASLVGWMMCRDVPLSKCCEVLES